MAETETGFKPLIIEDMPRWYGFKWHRHVPAIEVHVSRAVLSKVSRIPENILAHVASELGLDGFDALSADKYGFGGIIRRYEHQYVTRFIAPLPVSYFVLEEDCEECRGSAKNEYDDECLHCMGLGKKSKYRYKDAFAVASSIGFLLMSLEDLEWTEQTFTKQLMKLTVSPERGMDASFLCGTFGVPLVDWLSRQGMGPIPAVEEAMKTAYYHMFTKREWDSDINFRACVDSANGWLNISCPGQRCGIAPKLGSVRKGRGYEISSHNVDNPVQLLTLFAGLAALHDTVAMDIG